MAREQGSFSLNGNFEIQKSAPLDARGLVDTVDDLVNEKTWNSSDGGLYAYIGMRVSVPDDPDDSKIGVYMLKKFPTTNIENWYKLGSSNVKIEIEEIPNSNGRLRGIIKT